MNTKESSKSNYLMNKTVSLYTFLSIFFWCWQRSSCLRAVFSRKTITHSCLHFVIKKIIIALITSQLAWVLWRNKVYNVHSTRECGKHDLCVPVPTLGPGTNSATEEEVGDSWQSTVFYDRGCHLGSHYLNDSIHRYAYNNSPSTNTKEPSQIFILLM